MRLRSSSRSSSLTFSRRNRKRSSGATFTVDPNPSRLTRWSQSVDWNAFRFRFVAYLFCAVFFGLWLRAGWIQLLEGPRLAEGARRQHLSAENVSAERGMLLDRKGNVLARSVETRSIYANPHTVKDAAATAKTLAKILKLPPTTIQQSLKRSKQFVWIARRVDDATAEAVAQAKLPGVALLTEYERFYPHTQVAGQLLGFVGVDGNGLEGVERAFNDSLTGDVGRKVIQRDAGGRRYELSSTPPSEATDIRLTIDLQVQFMAEDILARTVDEIEAKWGGALVLDVESGDVLAWAQYPFFNPNAYRKANAARYRNHLSLDALEPGSTFKPFLVAAALQENLIQRDSIFDCEDGIWKVGSTTIRDDGRAYGLLPVHRILALSSNIGTAKIGLDLGAETYHAYLTKLGFGERTGLVLSENVGILREPKEWSKSDLLSASFGQSLSVTAVQMAQAYLTLANGGVNKPLNLVLNPDQRIQSDNQRVFSEKVAKEVLDMMHEVVADGTGRNAAIEGISVAGKTGTAQKADKTGTYGEARLASFVGMTPADKPQYLVVIMLDEPSTKKYGGAVAAPVFKELVSRVLAYYGTAPDPATLIATKEQASYTMPTLDEKKLEKALPTEIRRSLINTPRSVVAHGTVPNVIGKSLRQAVEMFAQQGLMPDKVNGMGARVVRQSPQAGTLLAKGSKNTEYTLWLSEE